MPPIQADPQATITLLTLLILYGLFANAAFTFFRTRRALDDLGRIIALFIITGLLLSLTQILTGTGFVAAGKITTQRAFGSDVHPVSFAVQILAAMVALEVLRVKRRLRFGLSHGVLLGLGCIALYLTYARTAWVMALIILALAIILRGSLARRITIAAIAGAGGAIILLSSDRFTDLGSLPFFLENFSFQDAVFDWRYVDNSVSWRIVNWSYGLQQALQQPWLGFGPGQSAVSSYFNLEMHNIFLEVFFEGGFFGLGALIVTVFGLVRMHAHLPAVDAADRYARILANSFGFTLLLAATFLAVTFSTSFVDQLMSFLLYVFIVAAAAIPANSASGPA